MTHQFGHSQALRRVEDQRLITGHGRYVDDVNLTAQLVGYVLRSPHAFAKINGMDAEAARAMPGVAAIYTVADLRAKGVGDLPCVIPLKNRDGSDRADPPRPALADGFVRHVGDPVAFVVAESLAQAKDAAEAIFVDYEMLDAVSDFTRADTAGQPQIWPQAPQNRAFDWERGDRAKTDALFAQAAHVARLEVTNNRIVVASMEPRAALAAYDAAAERFTVYANTQGVHLLKELLSNRIFHMPPEKFHILTPDVGGGFGMKLYLYPEHVLCCFAARELGRPVKWTSERVEAFQSDTQGRANQTVGELALDADGRFLAMRVHIKADMGGYLSTFAPMIPTMAGTKVLPSVYDIQSVYVHVEGFFSNSVPIDAYRGAGRPEANYLTERLIDVAAHDFGMDRVELRRKNYVSPAAMPYTTAMGITYDSGEFEAAMMEALELSDWAGFAARKANAARRGKRLGIGVASYLEATAASASERAEVQFAEDGFVEILVGTQSTGQGHETAYIQILSQTLGIPHDKIRVVQGDSDRILSGGGTGGARSLYSEGGAILDASARVIEKGRAAAADALEASVADIEFQNGTFGIVGTDRRISIMALAAQVKAKGQSLDASADHGKIIATYPNGCHVAEVEVDEATGVARVVRYVVVDDMGKVLNPMIAEGQIHGGVAQGIGQALYEHTVFTPEGQLQTASFMDYCLPRADDLPPILVKFREVPCTTNPLGVKGAGEAGSVGSCPAVINALCDALDVRHIDMPALPEAIWRVLHNRA